jgi:hypothetical protein
MHLWIEDWGFVGGEMLGMGWAIGLMCQLAWEVVSAYLGCR